MMPKYNYITGVPATVPNVTVDNSTIKITGNNVTLTLSWGSHLIIVIPF